MRQAKACLVVVAVLAMVGGAAPAWACEIQGNLVCENDTSVAVPGEAIEFHQTAGDVTGPSSFTLTSDASGNIGSGTHVGWETSWDVTYFGSFTCGSGGQNWIGQILVPSTNPKCGGPGGADCSPGFYKNHLTAWCPAGSAAATSGITCQDDRTYTCAQLVCLLSAEPPCKSKEPQRAFAKACLDAISAPTICTESEVTKGIPAKASTVAEVATAATGGCNSSGGSIGWLGLVGLALHGARRRARPAGQARV